MSAVNRLAHLAGEAPAPELGSLVTPRSALPYRPIREYALIGDCHGAALVAGDGGIDWCCLGRFDADPIFTRLLDQAGGGRFELCPEAPFSAHRRYRPRTAILETEFATRDGRVQLVDYMPVGRRPGQRLRDYAQLNAPGWIVRHVRGLSGRTAMRLDFRPVARFGAEPVRPVLRDGVLQADGVSALHATVPLSPVQGGGVASFTVGSGESVLFLLAPQPVRSRDWPHLATELEEVTQRFWEEWLESCDYDGPYRKDIRRSAITLKLLSYAPTGAFVAAPTTSLPEEIGGLRNWDYRFCWLRDSGHTLYALAGLGFADEAHGFVDFLRARQFRQREVHLVYGIDEASELVERELPHLDGYRGSRPVRIGNAAHAQSRNDVFGDVLDLALLYRSLGGELEPAEIGSLCCLADRAGALWHEPDNGIWEVRSEPRHFVYSKIMCWVALDRALRLFGERASWRQACDAILAEVNEKGRDPGGDHLVQYYGASGTDAALLLIPWTGFPLDRGLLLRSIAAVVEELRDGDYLRRYRSDDGLSGRDGAFLTCSFWLVDALLWLEQAEEAMGLFERLLRQASDLGLYAEEIEPGTHQFLGNYPQAQVHLAVVNSGLRIELYRRGGRAALLGSHGDRARRHVPATHGIGGAFTRLRKRLKTVQGPLNTRSVLRLP